MIVEGERLLELSVNATQSAPSPNWNVSLYATSIRSLADPNGDLTPGGLSGFLGPTGVVFDSTRRRGGRFFTLRDGVVGGGAIMISHCKTSEGGKGSFGCAGLCDTLCCAQPSSVSDRKLANVAFFVLLAG